jgi:hypothetical protein
MPAAHTAYSNNAVWALTLALTSMALGTLAWFVLLITVSNSVVHKLGADATPDEVAQEIQKMMIEGRMPRPPLSTGAALLGTLCGIGGLALAVRALILQERRRGLAIIACVISPAFLFCQIPLLMALLGRTMGQG